MDGARNWNTTGSLDRREHAKSNQHPAVLCAFRVIDPQHVNRCPPDLHSAEQLGASPGEVIVPSILSWIEERNKFIRLGVKAGGMA